MPSKRVEVLNSSYLPSAPALFVFASSASRCSAASGWKVRAAVRKAIATATDELCRYPDGNGFELKIALAERFGGRIVCHAIHVPSYGVDVLEVFDPAVNKWEGILHVARRRGILPSQIVAVGDDVNDITMLQHAGLGVAMGNAKPEAIAVADRVINRNDADGLAEFLEELVESQAVAPVAPPSGA